MPVSWTERVAHRTARADSQHVACRRGARTIPSPCHPRRWPGQRGARSGHHRSCARSFIVSCMMHGHPHWRPIPRLRDRSLKHVLATWGCSSLTATPLSLSTLGSRAQRDRDRRIPGRYGAGTSSAPDRWRSDRFSRGATRALREAPPLPTAANERTIARVDSSVAKGSPASPDRLPHGQRDSLLRPEPASSSSSSANGSTRTLASSRHVPSTVHRHSPSGKPRAFGRWGRRTRHARRAHARRSASSPRDPSRRWKVREPRRSSRARARTPAVSGSSGHPLTTPAGEIGNEHIVMEMKLRLVKQDHPPGPPCPDRMARPARPPNETTLERGTTPDAMRDERTVDDLGDDVRSTARRSSYVARRLAGLPCLKCSAERQARLWRWRRPRHRRPRARGPEPARHVRPKHGDGALPLEAAWLCGPPWTWTASSISPLRRTTLPSRLRGHERLRRSHQRLAAGNAFGASAASLRSSSIASRITRSVSSRRCASSSSASARTPARAFDRGTSSARAPGSWRCVDRLRETA